MKKIMMILQFVLIFIIALSFKQEAYGMKIKREDVNIEVILESDTIVPYAEEVEWYYRYKDGKLQKRLWSITYGSWKTNWIWV